MIELTRPLVQRLRPGIRHVPVTSRAVIVSMAAMAAETQRVPVRIGSYGAKRDDVLCQNCVRYSLKRRPNTVIYGDTLMHTVVAGSR